MVGFLKKLGIKSYILFILIIVFPAVLVAGYEAWDSWSEDAERQHVKDELLHAPSNRNIRTIQQIQEALAGKEHFSFAVIGDTHQRFSVLREIVRQASVHDPAFFVHTGDFTNYGRYKEYTKTIDFFDEIDIPFVVCAGNHDMELYGARCFSHLFGPLNFFFDIQENRFIFLNNVERSVNVDLAELPSDDYAFRLGRGIDMQMISYIETLIRQSERNFIVMHIPPPVPPFDFYCFKRNGENFINTITQNAERIARVFFGHIHGYGETCFQNVTYIQAGGGNTCDSAFKKNREGIISRHNYVLVTVSPEKVTHTVHYID